MYCIEFCRPEFWIILIPEALNKGRREFRDLVFFNHKPPCMQIIENRLHKTDLVCSNENNQNKTTEGQRR